MQHTHRIIAIRGHFEAYDAHGAFLVSGDSWEECYNELLDMENTDGKERAA